MSLAAVVAPSARSGPHRIERFRWAFRGQRPHKLRSSWLYLESTGLPHDRKPHPPFNLRSHRLLDEAPNDLKRDRGEGTSVRVIAHFKSRIMPFRDGLNDRKTKPRPAYTPTIKPLAPPEHIERGVLHIVR